MTRRLMRRRRRQFYEEQTRLTAPAFGGVDQHYIDKVEREFEMFDLLPGGIRRALQEGVVVWDEKPIFAILPRLEEASSAKERRRLIVDIVAIIKGFDRQNVQDYAFQYRQAYGEPYPHVAAHATILRHDSAAKLRKARAAQVEAASELRANSALHHLRAGSAERSAPFEVHAAEGEGTEERRPMDRADVPPAS